MRYAHFLLLSQKKRWTYRPGHCQSIHAQCEYDMHTDGRRVFPKSVTDALQLRVSALEALLTARNIPIDEVELLNMIDKDMGKDVNEDGQADLRRHKSWERLKNMDPQLPLGDEELNFGIDRLKVCTCHLLPTDT